MSSWLQPFLSALSSSHRRLDNLRRHSLPFQQIGALWSTLESPLTPLHTPVLGSPVPSHHKTKGRILGSETSAGVSHRCTPPCKVKVGLTERCVTAHAGRWLFAYTRLWGCARTPLPWSPLVWRLASVIMLTGEPVLTSVFVVLYCNPNTAFRSPASLSALVGPMSRLSVVNLTEGVGGLDTAVLSEW